MLFSEPKIPHIRAVIEPRQAPHRGFQCSSASRKFLTFVYCTQLSRTVWRVSVLFSEPKIPHIDKAPEGAYLVGKVSVLFSEPKIPHIVGWTSGATRCILFQCSSASRKFLTSPAPIAQPARDGVSVLFSEPKIPHMPTLAPASIHISDRDDHASSFLSLPGASP